MTNEFIVQGIGVAAGLLTTFAFAPQALHTWRTRSTQDISLGMFLMMCSGVILWLAYGILLGQWPIILSNVGTLALASVILAVKLGEGARGGNGAGTAPRAV